MARTMIGLLGMLALSAGCASTSQERSAARPGGEALKAQQAKNPESKVVCTVETPTGSRIAQRICRIQEQSTLEQKLVQDMTQTPRVTPFIK